MRPTPLTPLFATATSLNGIVKTRTSTNYGTPAEAVTDDKASRIRRLARRWRHTHRVHHWPLRFDIIAILWPPNQTPRIRHLQGAF